MGNLVCGLPGELLLVAAVAAAVVAARLAVALLVAELSVAVVVVAVAADVVGLALVRFAAYFVSGFGSVAGSSA